MGIAAHRRTPRQHLRAAPARRPAHARGGRRDSPLRRCAARGAQAPTAAPRCGPRQHTQAAAALAPLPASVLRSNGRRRPSPRATSPPLGGARAAPSPREEGGCVPGGAGPRSDVRRPQTPLAANHVSATGRRDSPARQRQLRQAVPPAGVRPHGEVMRRRGHPSPRATAPPLGSALAGPAPRGQGAFRPCRLWVTHCTWVGLCCEHAGSARLLDGRLPGVRARPKYQGQLLRPFYFLPPPPCFLPLQPYIYSFAFHLFVLFPWLISLLVVYLLVEYLGCIMYVE